MQKWAPQVRCALTPMGPQAVDSGGFTPEYRRYRV
jgi:hypothetical protein